MLEKVAGIALVNKLRAILLIEADFNFHNKLIFGKRMLNQAQAEGVLPTKRLMGSSPTFLSPTFLLATEGNGHDVG